MLTILKYPLEVKYEQVVRLPSGFTVLCVQTQGLEETPSLWVMLDNEQKIMYDFHVFLVGTKHVTSESAIHPRNYIGTFQRKADDFAQKFVYHVFGMCKDHGKVVEHGGAPCPT